MRIMKITMLNHPHSIQKEELPPMAMALGFFDGVHAGHQQVIETAKNIAAERNWKSAVMTFDPHPSVVLGKKHEKIQYITPLEEKIRMIEHLGIDHLFVIRFTSDFANLEPQQFVDQYIIGLNVQHVVAGYDFTYGRCGNGTMDTLPMHSRHLFAITKVDKLAYDGEKVSSTKIRCLLTEGQIEEANRLLGRPYRITGTVVHGDQRGRKIGFPTANVECDDDYYLPKTGVYAVKMKVKDKWVNGVCNIGYRPTFKQPDERFMSIEVHLFEFDHSIYGEEVTVEWYKHIRQERKFNGVQELVAQIEKDKQSAIKYFQNEAE